jgi:K+-transporting ATPase KdpF subunit
LWANDRHRARPPGASEGGPAVNAVNLIGLILSIILTVFLVIALVFPEKF